MSYARVSIQFTGMLHAGIGETHVNNLLTAINVPEIHHKTLKRREREAGKGLEALAERTIQEALREEVEKTRKRLVNISCYGKKSLFIVNSATHFNFIHYVYIIQ